MWNDLVSKCPKVAGQLLDTNEKKQNALELIKNNPEMSIRQIAELLSPKTLTPTRFQETCQNSAKNEQNKRDKSLMYFYP